LSVREIVVFVAWKLVNKEKPSLAS
jgi:hypothetical protein